MGAHDRGAKSDNEGLAWAIFDDVFAKTGKPEMNIAHLVKTRSDITWSESSCKRFYQRWLELDARQKRSLYEVH
jgi:hypothetical protein